MKLLKNNLANCLALATAILWVICSAFVAIFPDFSLKVTQWWAHGMELEAFSLGLGNFIWGGITLVGSLWIVGYVLAWSLEYVDKKSSNK